MEEREGGDKGTKNATKGDFEGYNKIYESTTKWQPEKGLLKKCKWCVTEKVHGANFCFIVNGTDPERSVFCAKRRAILPPSEDFFGHKSLLPGLSPKLTKLYSLLSDPSFDLFTALNFALLKRPSGQSKSGETKPKKKVPSNSDLHGQLARVFIFGEIFGGLFPSTSTSSKVEPVQTGIYYTPSIDFYAFDLAVSFTPKPHKLHYLNFDTSLILFTTVQLFHAASLFTGTYEECLEYTINFESTIPERLGLPPPSKNKAEGVVIRPLKTLYVMTPKGKIRAIVKKKIEEFSEAKYYGAKKWDNEEESPSRNSHCEMMKYEMQALITENRVANAISKLGRVNAKDTAQMKNLLNMYIEDVVETLQEENEENWQKLTQEEKDGLRNEIRLLSKIIIYEYFKLNKLL